MGIVIAGREIGPSHATFVIAEMSANHGHDINKAMEIIRIAKECGADAVKLQTYTPDTMTIDCDNEYFRIGNNSLWDGQTLYELYREAYTPWEWHAPLQKYAEQLGIILFSTPFDKSAVDLLEKLDIPAYKIASFELVDIPLIKYVASKQKPVILSTGMASLEEIYEAVEAVKSTGNDQYAILKCVSDYPARPEDMNLRTIEDMKRRFACPVGLSDHSLGSDVARLSVAAGASIIEKHLISSRSDGGPDAAFSMEAAEFKDFVAEIRKADNILGRVCYEPSEKEIKNKIFRRSLFVVEDIKKGDVLTVNNVRSIRPGFGLSPKNLNNILGRTANKDLKRGLPLNMEDIL